MKTARKSTPKKQPLKRSPEWRSLAVGRAMAIEQLKQQQLKQQIADDAADFERQASTHARERMDLRCKLREVEAELEVVPKWLLRALIRFRGGKRNR